MSLLSPELIGRAIAALECVEHHCGPYELRVTQRHVDRAGGVDAIKAFLLQQGFGDVSVVVCPTARGNAHRQTVV